MIRNNIGPIRWELYRCRRCSRRSVISRRRDCCLDITIIFGVSDICGYVFKCDATLAAAQVTYCRILLRQLFLLVFVNSFSMWTVIVVLVIIDIRFYDVRFWLGCIWYHLCTSRWWTVTRRGSWLWGKWFNFHRDERWWSPSGRVLRMFVESIQSSLCMGVILGWLQLVQFRVGITFEIRGFHVYSVISVLWVFIVIRRKVSVT